MGASRFSFTETCSDQPAPSTIPTTLVPSAGPVPSSAAATTTPETSWPGGQPSDLAFSSLSSPRFTLKA
jgi:hypothetical protein